jgi:Domain of unknown function (DUF4124)
MMVRPITLAAAAFLIASPAARAADTSVFRCVDPGGRVLYTDVPCRNAAVVELHPGAADPAAAQRLRQAQAMLDAGMDKRRAEDARDAERREAFAQARDAALAAQPPEPAPVVDYWPVYGGYVGPIRPRPHHGVSPKHVGPSKPRPPTGGKPPHPPRTEPPRR